MAIESAMIGVIRHIHENNNNKNNETKTHENNVIKIPKKPIQVYDIKKSIMIGNILSIFNE